MTTEQFHVKNLVLFFFINYGNKMHVFHQCCQAFPPQNTRSGPQKLTTAQYHKTTEERKMTTSACNIA